MDEDVEVGPEPHHVLAYETSAVRLFELPLEHLLDVEEFTTNVDVGHLRADRVARNHAALEQQVRVALQEQMIFERPRLALVGIADEVLRLRRVLHDELPLHAGRETGAAATLETRRLHDVDDLLGLHRERLPQPLIALVLQIEIERIGAGFAHESGEYRFHDYRSGLW